MSTTTKRRGHQKKGTHGSLSKAGKFRDAHPITNWRLDPKTGIPVKSKPRKGKGRSKGDAQKRGRRKKVSRIKTRQRYKIATMCPACSGTTFGRTIRTPIKIGVHKCWKCNTRLEWRGLRPRIKERRKIQ